MVDLDDDALLEALGVTPAPLKPALHSPREERILAGFEDILRFYQTHGRAPQHGQGQDIFERLYAVRLDRLRQSAEALALLQTFDTPGLLLGAGRGVSSSSSRGAGHGANGSDVDQLSADALLDALVQDTTPARDAGEFQDITVLHHVRSTAEKREIAQMAERSVCQDFAAFAPRFAQTTRALAAGALQTQRFGEDVRIGKGEFFIVGGQMAYVAGVGEAVKTSSGHDDARLRVVYDNGTESNLLLRSLQKALYKDPTGRRIADIAPGPLFGAAVQPDDQQTGTVYVLRSMSTHPFVQQHRELIHKIGVTGGSVKDRIAQAAKDATYLLADVEVVAEYALHNINRSKLEGVFHQVFASARLDLALQDRFGQTVKPKEWFLVPLPCIDQVVAHLHAGTLAGLRYDAATASLRAET